jgi:hypothetical protein
MNNNSTIRINNDNTSTMRSPRNLLACTMFVFLLCDDSMFVTWFREHEVTYLEYRWKAAKPFELSFIRPRETPIDTKHPFCVSNGVHMSLNLEWSLQSFHMVNVSVIWHQSFHVIYGSVIRHQTCRPLTVRCGLVLCIWHNHDCNDIGSNGL